MSSTQLVPNHYKKFSCIGSNCENHCCQGWVVPIDKKTYKKYQNSKDKDLVKNIKRFKNNNIDLPYASIQMKECGVCPFFMEDGLCYIHTTYGEEMLSKVCDVFPRVKNVYNNILEQSLYLSCPEAARVTLLNPNPMEFDFETINHTNKDTNSKQVDFSNRKSTLSTHFFLLRSFAIEIIQNRQWDLKNRLLLLGFWIQQLEKWEGLNISETEIIQAFDEFIFSHSELINKGEFTVLMQSTKGMEKKFMGFFQTFFSIRLELADSHDQYQQLSSRVLNSMGWNEGIIEDWINRYGAIKEKSFKAISEKEYIFENFIVNEMFKDLFPFGEDTMWNHYLLIVLNYTFLKVHFMSIFIETNRLDDSNIINDIHIYVRSSLHRKSYVNNLLKYAKDNNISDLASVVGLISL